jgi:cysteine desulfurase
MGEAYRIAKLGDARRKQAHPRCSSMLAGLKTSKRCFLNGDAGRVPHNLNMSFNFVEGES